MDLTEYLTAELTRRDFIQSLAGSDMGNRAKKIDDVERVETVFKDGLGYAVASAPQPFSPLWKRAP